MTRTIAVLRGDGIGPEVIEAALRVLRRLRARSRCARRSSAAPPSTRPATRCRRTTLELAARATPCSWAPWAARAGNAGRCAPRTASCGLRQGLGLFANLRPARYMGLPTPLREGLARQADILVVRELSGGVYFGEPRGTGADARPSTPGGRPRTQVAPRGPRRLPGRAPRAGAPGDLGGQGERARGLAAVARGRDRGRGTSIPDVDARAPLRRRHELRAAAAPQRFDVILTENLFGDILSDELAAVAGSIGLLPSASLGDGPPLYEPVHGSAPTLAGRGHREPRGRHPLRGHDARARARPARPRAARWRPR